MATLLEMPDRGQPLGCRDRAMLELFYASGLRLSELVGLDVEDLNLSARMVRVMGKGRKERIVPFTQTAADAIAACLQDRDRMVRAGPGHLAPGSREPGARPQTQPLFVNYRGCGSPGEACSVSCGYVSLCSTRFGISPHALRIRSRRICSRAAPTAAIQELLGHVQLSTTQRYTHVNAAQLLEVYRKAHPSRKEGRLGKMRHLGQVGRHDGHADNALDRLFFRSAGAPLVDGNAVQVLLDGDQNYPRWLHAIDQAAAHDPPRDVHRAQRRHRPALSRRAGGARAGRCHGARAVRLVRRVAAQLVPFLGAADRVPAARCASSTRHGSTSLLNLGSRDHRKLLTVDGRVAYIGGLCIGDDWLGDPAQDIPAWRDTGIELRGPAVAEAELAFAGAWAAWGEGLPPGTVPAREDIRAPKATSACAWCRPRPTAPRSTASNWPRSRRPAIASGSPTPTSWARRSTSSRSARRPATAWTSGCWCPTTATCAGSATCRARCTAACSTPASASSSGTAR